MRDVDNLIDYIISNSDERTAYYLDMIRYHLGGKIYHYGEQFKYPKTRKRKRPKALSYYVEYLILKSTFFFRWNSDKSQIKILSSASSSWNTLLNDRGYHVYRPPWDLRRDLKIDCSLELYLLTKRIKYHLEHSNFNYLISSDFIALLELYEGKLGEYCLKMNFDAVIVLQYNGFFERCVLNVFNKNERVSFFWHHGGVPSFYDPRFERRADYFIMWGELQVDSYIKMGYSPDKFLTSGHPVYNSVPKALLFELDNVLILTKSLLGVSPLERPHKEDRGNALMYLYSIKRVLEKHNVKSVRLRPHPSENFSWYREFLDPVFFKEDTQSVQDSLKSSSLVIGPTSTMIIDTLKNQVSYLIYEPLINGKSILGWPLTPPIDGMNIDFPVANTEHGLNEFIENNICCSFKAYTDLVTTPRDLTFFDAILK
jgi:hypothetical protein